MSAPKELLIVGGMGGRIDHEIANISVVLKYVVVTVCNEYRYANKLPATLLSERDVVYALTKGHHRIITNPVYEGALS